MTNDQCSSSYYINTTFILNENGVQKQNIMQYEKNQKPIALLWKNLRYEINEWYFDNISNGDDGGNSGEINRSWISWPRRRRKIILRRLNGSLRKNSLNALLGPSGAGKTSLIKCLTGNISRSNMTSDTEIYLNRSILDQRIINKRMTLVGSVPQSVHEIVFGRFTVKELFYYAFRFKNSFGQRDQANKHILNVMNELMLDSRILETKFEQCSGGEQRRVAIAQELMSIESPPPFLFVDEPTTGLDSEAALLVMQCLQRLSLNKSLTIMVSIHAPSSEILMLFDHLYILAKGGICVYSGQPDLMRSYLRQTIQLEIDADRSPIEEYLRIASNGINAIQVRDLANNTLEQENHQMTMNDSFEYLVQVPNGMPKQTKSFKFDDLFIQMYRILRFIFVVDVQKLLCIILVNALFIGIIGLTCNSDMVRPSGCRLYDHDRYNRTCQDELEDGALIGTYVFYQELTFILLSCSAMGFSSVYLVELLKVFINEHRNGWYSLSTFFFAFQFGQLAQMSVSIINLTMVAYFTGGYFSIDNYQFNWNRIGHFIFYYSLLMVYLQSHGQFGAIIFMDNIQIMTICLQLVYSILMMLNGISITLEIMDNSWLIIISHLLGIRYIADGLLFSFYGIDRCDTENEYSHILHDSNINPNNIYTNILSPLLNIIALRVATFILMYFRFTFMHKSIGQKFEQQKRSANMITIDYDHVDDNQNEKKLIPERFHKNIKYDHNRQQKFLVSRHIIGWRSLYVFAKESIYESRPAPKQTSDPSERLILRNLNGQLRFGTINALMGTSGSGKTTLLKVLNGRKKTRLADCSEFYLSKYIPIRTCYISQEVSGHLLPGLTALQSLIYASKLKNCHVEHDGKTFVDHEKLANNILDELDLTDAANTMVQYCSGGQRKRLALALELTSVHMPNLICIDEPTSGLDSNSARLVVQILDRLVDRHPDICIVASIHQPNTELLMMFNHCYVLARDGICIYSGKPAGIKEYLDQISVLESDRDRFPIEQLIKYSCSGGDNRIVRQMAETSEKLIRQTDNSLQTDTITIPDGVEFNRIRFSLHSLWILSQRYLVFMIKYQWKEWLAFLFIYMAFGIALVVFFNRNIAQPSGCLNPEDDFLAFCSGNKSADRTIEEKQVVNSIYFMTQSSFLFTLFLSVQIMFSFINELEYFLNEHRNGWYSCGVFYLQKFLFETIPLIPIIMIYVYIIDIFSIVSANNYYLWHVIILFLASISFQAISHFVALITNGHFVLMIVCLSSFSAAFMVFSNAFNPIAQLNYGLRFLSNFSVFRFVNQADFWLVYGGQRCHEHEIQSILYQLMIPNTVDHFFHCILMLAVLALFYHCLAFWMLFIKSNPMNSRRSRVKRIERFYQQRLMHRIPSTTTSSATQSPSISSTSDNFITIRL